MDVNDVGQGRAHNEAVEKYDAEHGKYTPSVAGRIPIEQLTQIDQMPEAPNPDPFTVGPAAPTGR
jgi:hypothetical protein